MNKESDARCLKAFGAYDRSLYEESQYTYYYVTPLGRQDWDSGDRLLTCVVFLYRHWSPRGKPLYASIRAAINDGDGGAARHRGYGAVMTWNAVLTGI